MASAYQPQKTPRPSNPKIVPKPSSGPYDSGWYRIVKASLRRAKDGFELDRLRESEDYKKKNW